MGPGHACAPAAACQRVLARQRCTANRTKPPATVHCSPSCCVRYRCGSSATSSSAARLKRRGQQERQARERRERARKKLGAAGCGAGCSSGALHRPRFCSVKPLFFKQKGKNFFAGLCPAPRWGSAPDPGPIDHARRRLHVVPTQRHGLKPCPALAVRDLGALYRHRLRFFHPCLPPLWGL